MSLFQTPIPKLQIAHKREGSPLRSPRDSTSLGKEWRYVNQGNDRANRVTDSLAAISRKVTARDPLGAFDSFHPFQIYQLPYEMRTVHNSNDWQKFRVRLGYVEMFARGGVHGERTYFIPVTGVGMDKVYPMNEEIYSTASIQVNSVFGAINETLDVLLDPITFGAGDHNTFVFYIQLSTDPTAFPTATLQVSGINGNPHSWSVSDPFDSTGTISSEWLDTFGGDTPINQTQIPIGAVQFVQRTTVSSPNEVGAYPTPDANVLGYRIIQMVNRNLVDRFPDSQMRFVEPSGGSGKTGIEWDPALAYHRGDVVTVTSGGSASTYLALAVLPDVGVGNTPPNGTQWTKIADFTP